MIHRMLHRFERKTNEYNKLLSPIEKKTFKFTNLSHMWAVGYLYVIKKSIIVVCMQKYDSK